MVLVEALDLVVFRRFATITLRNGAPAGADETPREARSERLGERCRRHDFDGSVW
jgi:hypothetical protein